MFYKIYIVNLTTSTERVVSNNPIEWEHLFSIAAAVTNHVIQLGRVPPMAPKIHTHPQAEHIHSIPTLVPKIPNPFHC